MFILLLPVLDSDFFVLTGLTPFLLLFDVPLVAMLAWMWIAMHRGQTA